MKDNNGIYSPGRGMFVQKSCQMDILYLTTESWFSISESRIGYWAKGSRQPTVIQKSFWDYFILPLTVIPRETLLLDDTRVIAMVETDEFYLVWLFAPVQLSKSDLLRSSDWSSSTAINLSFLSSYLLRTSEHGLSREILIIELLWDISLRC